MNLKAFSLLLFSLLLFACTSPPESVEPAASDNSAAQETLADSAVEPTAVVVQDYPSPVAIIDESNAQAEGYPAPESALVTENGGYPAPETDSNGAIQAPAEVVEGSEIVEYADPDNAESEEALPDRTGPQSREIQVTAPDELNLFGTYNTLGSAEPQPAVLLLHMLGGTRKDWEASGFSQQLNENGFITLALDMRGHGESISNRDWVKSEEDLLLAWEWLISQPEVDAENGFIIGASIGGNMALRTAANAPTVKGTVLLSPGLNYRDVTTDDAIANMDRPVLMFAMTNDSYSANSVNQLGELNTAQATANVIDGAAHGTNMLGAYEGLEDQILAFLNSNLN